MSGSTADASAGPSSPALQVIVLGSGGGPQEFNTTAFLVRSTAEGWRRGSIVSLDAGVLMGAITRILEQTLPPGLAEANSSPSDEGSTPESSELSLPYTLTTGPFAGLEVPYATAGANASFVQSALIDTYLITHPHLDHISGFVINTAGLPGTRPKRLAGLPSTIAAFKAHIFNNVIWPNLSDENNGAGLVTYMRLVEGGSPALGDGDGRGYVEISDGLAVKIWGVSHGHCIERHSHRGSGAGTRFGSMDGSSMPLGPSLLSPHGHTHHNVTSATYTQPLSSSPSAPQPVQQAQSQPQSIQLPPSLPSSAHGTPQLGPQHRDSLALLSSPGSAAAARRGSLGVPQQVTTGESVCVYDSSAYFIRDVKTAREVLMFGDVEPDSISLSPRNCLIWQEAAPKIAAGKLSAIFVECSYDDSQPLDRLYGHLTPRFVVEEMGSLAAEVAHARIAHKQQELQKQQQQRERDGRKRKRHGGDEDRSGNGHLSRTNSHGRRKTEIAMINTSNDITTNASSSALLEDPVSPRTVKPARLAVATRTDHGTTQPDTPHIATPTADLSMEADMSQPSITTTDEVKLVADAEPEADEPRLPLSGLKVVIIHIKEKLRDGPPAGEIILDQLQAHEARNPLGCEYIISYSGQSLFF
ncbi:camp phosphodiesterase class-ii [Ophiostoma piceae UAMH 11346]|uniref:Camp phosphodiesterase class-ii n=1 Tax=Ophiostoma piceae (strain UAMH 11346) TaxID=1262450 RepID=S3CC35_OPHP1|nr:camp phosphodiesterase class-ii [Ophiostoma piceae UAMH 11346]